MAAPSTPASSLSSHPFASLWRRGGGEKTNVKREWQWVGLVKRDGEQWSKKKENEKERGEMDRQIHQRKGERERDGLKNKRRGGKDEY